MAATDSTLDGLQAGSKPRVILQFSMPVKDMNPVRYIATCTCRCKWEMNSLPVPYV